VDGDYPRLALELGLVDRIMTRAEAYHELAAAGAAARGTQGFRHIEFRDYLAQTDLQGLPRAGNKVAVVVIEGEIMRGHQPPGRVGTETLSQRLQEVAEDEKIKAVVLRVNSPGGEVFASEKVRRDVQAVRDSGRTVVVSMGDVAASGAYWLAMAADEVWASPATLTGSIGVFGFLPTFAEPLGDLGIYTDGVGTTPLAGKLRLDLPLDEDLKRIYQLTTERTYEEFLEVVATGRGMDIDSVNEVARGRVWSGVQAKERGLIDQLGTQRQAIDSAARIAGLGSDYEVVYSEAALSPLESLLLDMTGSSMKHLGFKSFFENPFAGTPVERLLRSLMSLARHDGEFVLTAHCLCVSP